MMGERLTIIKDGGGGGALLSRAVTISEQLGHLKNHQIVHEIGVGDSGGQTGLLRARFPDIIAFGDYLHLTKDSRIHPGDDAQTAELLQQVLQYRPDKNGHVLPEQAFLKIEERSDAQYKPLFRGLLADAMKHGNIPAQLLFARIFREDPQAGFSHIEDWMRKLGVELKGSAYPMTITSSDIVFRRKSGILEVGEHRLDELDQSDDSLDALTFVPRRTLFVRTDRGTKNPELSLNPDKISLGQVQEALDNGQAVDVGIYGPSAKNFEMAVSTLVACGSWPASTMGDGVINGAQDAIRSSNGDLILLHNLTGSVFEYPDTSFDACLDIATKHLGRTPNVVVVPRESREEFEKRHPDVAARYRQENSRFLGFTCDEIARVQRRGITVYQHDATIINDQGSIRHDPMKLAETLAEFM